MRLKVEREGREVWGLSGFQAMIYINNLFSFVSGEDRGFFQGEMTGMITRAPRNFQSFKPYKLVLRSVIGIISYLINLGTNSPWFSQL